MTKKKSQIKIPYPPGEQPKNWRTIIPKKFSHYCEGSEPHINLPRLGKGLGIPKESDFEGQWDLITDFHRTGGSRDSILGGHKQSLSCTKTQGKGAETT